jgi:hypothetical protein
LIRVKAIGFATLLALRLLTVAQDSFVSVDGQVAGKGAILGLGAYENGKMATVRGVPQVDWRFDHWEGVPDNLSTNNPLVIEAFAGLNLRAVMVASPGAGHFQGGKVIAWGNDSFGETIVPVTAQTGVIRIAAGGFDTVALKRDGSVVAWGENQKGQATVPSFVQTVAGIAAGGLHTGVVKKDGTILLWGFNGYGETTPPTTAQTDVASMALGITHTVILKADGSVMAWGSNDYGETTVPESARSDVTSIAAGGSETMALKKDGSIIAWGANWSGQANVPPFVQNGVTEIAVGGAFNAALRADGAVFAWGDNYSGQTNVPVAAQSGVRAIAAGAEFVLGLKSDGSVFGWGNNNNYQTNIPATAREGVTAIAAGYTHGVALKSDQLVMVEQAHENTLCELGRSCRFAPFIVMAAGYQWYHDGKIIPGATSKILEIARSEFSDAGDYQLLATNKTDALLTAPAMLQVVAVGTPRLQIGDEIVFTDSVRGERAILALSTSFSNGTIQFTLDGSAPGFDSASYSGPVAITNSVVVRALAYSSDFSQRAEMQAVVVRIVPTHNLSAITSGGSGQVFFEPFKSRYLEDEVVSVQANPAPGYRFVRWAGDVSGSYPQQQVVMSADKQVEAIFALIQKFALTTSVAGGGTITGNPASSYYIGTTLNLHAVAGDGWQFINWGGDVISDGTNCTVLIDAAKTVAAVFGTGLSNSVAGQGHLLLEPPQGPYPFGSKVRLTPVPDPGNYLALWGSSVAGQPKTSIEVTITNSSMLVSAIFAPLPANKFTVTAIAGSGGKVASSPADGAYINGQSVALAAQADSGYEFAGWSGDVISSENPLSVLADSNKTVRAAFRKAGGDLVTLTTNPVGQGRVSRSPDFAGYEVGTEVTLEAIPAADWAFIGWDDSVSTNARRVISIASNLVLHAKFSQKYLLATETSGEGIVLLSPPEGIYVDGSVVTATANPSTGWGFVGWSGDLDVTVPQANVVVNENKRIVATFARLGTLTTIVKGNGTVSRDPVQDQYLPGSVVQLTATAGSGYQFTGWSGGASGSVNPLAFKVDKATAVIANFLDIASPDVVIESPFTGSTNDERFVFGGTASDNAGITQLSWQWNDIDQGVLSISNGHFEVSSLHLHPGVNRFRVIASDAAGNQTSADREVTWVPLRTVAVRDAVEVQEGKRMEFALELESGGDVGSMNLLLHYDPVYLADPEWTWSSIAGSSINTLTTNISGEIRATFSLAGGVIPAATQSVATVRFRARSVPANVTTELKCELIDLADRQGNKFSFGNAIGSGNGRILIRRMLGDNNANNRLDIGDSTLIQRLLTGLDEVRAWDVSGNDLNGSGDLDSGDATKALRVVVGLDEAPAMRVALQQLKFQNQPAVSASGERAMLLLDSLKPSVGSKVAMQLVLTNIASPLSGVSFRLDYPTNALRLIDASSLNEGPLVPASAALFWNLLPGQSDFTTQNGGLLAGLSTAEPWGSQNGTLMQFQFQAQPGIMAQASWPVKASNIEITGDGFDTRLLGEASASVVGGTIVPPPELRIVQPVLENGKFKFRAMGTVGTQVIIQASLDARVWEDGIVISIQAEGADQSIPILTGVSQAFFRLKLMQ